MKQIALVAVLTLIPAFAARAAMPANEERRVRGKNG